MEKDFTTYDINLQGSFMSLKYFGKYKQQLVNL